MALRSAKSNRFTTATSTKYLQQQGNVSW